MSYALDAVILAGGRSERLHGVVPPYHKPFLVINGKSLLVSAVHRAIDAGAGRVIVVATGENAMPVYQLVGQYGKVRVVLADGGVARALSIGLEMCETSRVLVMMSDNVYGDDDVRNVTSYRYAIGTAVVPMKDAERFTRLIANTWVEGPLTDHEIEYIDSEDLVTVWCGPLVIARKTSLIVLNGYEKIGPVLSQIAPSAKLVQCDTVDAGTPEVVKELTS